MTNGRCRMHGGKSSGRPTTHGMYTREAIDERKHLHELIREMKRLAKAIDGKE